MVSVRTIRSALRKAFLFSANRLRSQRSKSAIKARVAIKLTQPGMWEKDLLRGARALNGSVQTLTPITQPRRLPTPKGRQSERAMKRNASQTAERSSLKEIFCMNIPYKVDEYPKDNFFCRRLHL